MNDLGTFIAANHLHQISGGSTILLAVLTMTSGFVLASNGRRPTLRTVHKGLAYAAALLGAVTVGLGATAFHDRVHEVWPHLLFMVLAELGLLLTAFVLKPGSVPHRVAGAASVVSLVTGLVIIIVLTAK